MSSIDQILKRLASNPPKERITGIIKKVLQSEELKTMTAEFLHLTIERGIKSTEALQELVVIYAAIYLAGYEDGQLSLTEDLIIK